VIHRDLKPANIVLGKYGETLVVDWGLAKAVGRADPSAGEQTLAPSSGGSSETMPGSALGTPAYMSPEQARGELNRLGPRSDVYSLGATLFCLLTGKPPVEGDDIGMILRAVQGGQYRRPSQHDPGLDKALEAVCLKAMAKEPEDRYPTPRALADDLDRWMADEPVSAWAEPWTRKLLRWLTRHRTGVTGAAAAVLAGVVGLSAVLAVQAQANAQLSASLTRETAANRALAESNDELTRAKTAVQAQFDLALEAIKRFNTGVSEDLLLKNDALKSLRDRLLSDSAKFYKRLGDLFRGRPDRRSRLALGQAYHDMAELEARIGANGEAIAAHRQALAIRRGLAEEPSAEGEATAEDCQSLTALGSVLEEIGLTEQAEEAYVEAIALLENLSNARPGVAVYRSDLGLTRHYLGRLLSRIARPDQAQAELRRSIVDLMAVVRLPVIMPPKTKAISGSGEAPLPRLKPVESPVLYFFFRIFGVVNSAGMGRSRLVR
jgi:serine/threonine-protein kinase